MALVHLGVVDDGHHGFEAALRDVEDAPHVILHVIARDGVRRERRGRGSNDGMLSGGFSRNVGHGFHPSPLWVAGRAGNLAPAQDFSMQPPTSGAAPMTLT